MTKRNALGLGLARQHERKKCNMPNRPHGKKRAEGAWPFPLKKAQNPQNNGTGISCNPPAGGSNGRNRRMNGG